jgi:Rrf2 family cysteine metabolism transcriptional repressor
MTLLSRKADYALLILSYLHGRPAGGNARAVAERFQLSRPFVANILKDLCHAGFVASHRGVKGGYALLRPAESVTLAELLDALGEGFRLTLCSHDGGDDLCTLAPACPVKGPLADINRRIVEVLRGVTLAELFAAPPAGPAVMPLGLLSVLSPKAEPRPEPATL